MLVGTRETIEIKMAPETAIIAQQSTHEISPNIPHSNEVTTIQVGLAINPVAFVLTLAFVFIKQVHQSWEDLLC